MMCYNQELGLVAEGQWHKTLHQVWSRCDKLFLTVSGLWVRKQDGQGLAKKQRIFQVEFRRLVAIDPL